MKQIIHIFRKDVRHHWIEIVICQLTLVAYCWNEMAGWGQAYSYVANMSSALIHLLLPLSWSIFIFRAVHDEPLVGDRQFWITRPYDWKKLLAEKILLVLVFINLPLIVAGIVLLLKAGFPAAPHLLGLVWMQLLLLYLPFLQLLALASVTRNVTQSLLGLLTVMLIFAGTASFWGILLATSGAAVDTDWLQMTVLALVCLVAIGMQYARRKTTQSRLWLAGGVLAMVVIVFIGHYLERKGELYPLPKQPASFHADLDPVALTAPNEPPLVGEDVNLAIPIRAEGILPGSLGVIRGVRIIFEAPDGSRVESGWQGSSKLLFPEDNRWSQHFTVTYKDYERLKSIPLKARVAVAVEVRREQDFESVTATGGEFMVPKVGRCRLGPGWGGVQCRAPLVGPVMVVLRTDPAQSPCAFRQNNTTSPTSPQYAWHPGRDSDLPQYGVSPLVSFVFYMREADLCPGTPFTFSFPQFVEDTRSDFELSNAEIDKYRGEALHGHFAGLAR